METTPYQMCINNARRHIRDNPAGTENCIDAFAFSTVIAICFSTSKEQVIVDLLNAENKNPYCWQPHQDEFPPSLSSYEVYERLTNGKIDYPDVKNWVAYQEGDIVDPEFIDI